MNVTSLECMENVYEFVKNINQGTNYFIYSRPNLLNTLDEIIQIINESAGSKKLLLRAEKDVDMLKFAGYTVQDNLHVLICNDKPSSLPVLSEDSLLLKNFMSQAFNYKNLIRFDLDPSLYRYAKKLASNKLIFGVDSLGAFFNGAEKELSIYEQITKAYYAGEDTIEFNAMNTSIATIRCYTSTLSKMSGKKIKCAIKTGVITVFLKPLTKKDELKRKVQYILNELDDEKQGFDLLREMLNESNIEYKEIAINNSIPVTSSAYIVNGIPVSAEEWMKQPIWVRQGYATEEDMNNDF